MAKYSQPTKAKPEPKGRPQKVTFSAYQTRMLDLLAQVSPWGTKATSVIEFIVARELDLLEESNRFGIRDRLQDGS